MNNTVGLSYAGTCFITSKGEYNVAVLGFIFYTLFLLSIVFNIWFLKYRDTSKDRNFINGYNYFILFTSFMWLPLVTHLILFCFWQINFEPLYYTALIFTHLCYLYISLFRLQIEYIQIVLSQGPSRLKWVNSILFLLGCYKKPKFKDIKRVLNVKYIETGQINDTQDTIFSHIMKQNAYDI
jgi:hypothetical protein